jgi:NADH dehydrogenase FAD-containing subunit
MILHRFPRLAGFNLPRLYSTVGPERVVILGSGWAGFKVMKLLDQRKYEVVVVSPRNYFVFTPLLASTCVGTLEFRCITEPIRRHVKDLQYYAATCQGVDLKTKQISCQSSADGSSFSLDYDKLVISCGAVTQTFNIPGVKEHAFFLKDVSDARQIRFRVIQNFEKASQPNTPVQVQKQLLHFATVGGGPTGVEFSAELHDFVVDDMAKLYPELMDKVTVSLYDVAPKILTSFDSSLADYATNRFKRQGISIKTGIRVQKVEADFIELEGGVKDNIGMVVWAAGLAPNPLISSLAHSVQICPTSKRILTDDHLRVLEPKDASVTSGDVYALGDCAVIKDNSLPATAQVANQKAIYLGRSLNKLAKGQQDLPPFVYKDMGSMAYVGGWTAIASLRKPLTTTLSSGSSNTNNKISESGILAWLFWRSAYFTMSVSWKNKILIPMYWFLTWIFGRDTTRL